MVDQTLKGKIAVVSGSTGGGIGDAIGRELALKGAHVVLNYPFASLKEQADETLATLAVPGIAVEADLSTVEGPKKLVDEAVAKYGHIDILVNCAAVAINELFATASLKSWDLQVNLNGRGYFLLTQYTLPHLTKKDSRIVNVISSVCKEAPPMQSIYAGTKGMTECFTKVWAKELPGTYGCTVNSVSPGLTMTSQLKQLPEELLAQFRPYLERVPVRQDFGTPEEVAWVVSLLAEPRSSWINGQNIHAGGGGYMP